MRHAPLALGSTPVCLAHTWLHLACGTPVSELSGGEVTRRPSFPWPDSVLSHDKARFEESFQPWASYGGLVPSLG